MLVPFGNNNLNLNNTNNNNKSSGVGVINPAPVNKTTVNQLTSASPQNRAQQSSQNPNDPNNPAAMNISPEQIAGTARKSLLNLKTVAMGAVATVVGAVVVVKRHSVPVLKDIIAKVRKNVPKKPKPQEAIYKLADLIEHGNKLSIKSESLSKKNFRPVEIRFDVEDALGVVKSNTDSKKKVLEKISKLANSYRYSNDIAPEVSVYLSKATKEEKELINKAIGGKNINTLSNDLFDKIECVKLNTLGRRSEKDINIYYDIRTPKDVDINNPTSTFENIKENASRKIGRIFSGT